MRMRKIYALPPDIQAELDAVKLEQQHAERRSSTSTQLSTSGGSYRSSVTSLATSTGSAGDTDSEGLPVIVQHVSDAPGDGRATAAGVAAFRRRLAVKGPSHSQVEFLSGLMDEAAEQRGGGSGDVWGGMEAVRGRLLGVGRGGGGAGLPDILQSPGHPSSPHARGPSLLNGGTKSEKGDRRHQPIAKASAGTTLLFAAAKNHVVATRVTKEPGKRRSALPASAGTTLLFAAAKNHVAANRASKETQKRRSALTGPQCHSSSLLKFTKGDIHGVDSVAHVALVPEEESSAAMHWSQFANSQGPPYAGRQRAHTHSGGTAPRQVAAPLSVRRLMGGDDTSSTKLTVSTDEQDNDHVLRSLAAIAATAKQAAKLKVIRNRVRPTQWALSSLLQMEVGCQKRKILDRILTDHASKDHLINLFLNELGDMSIPSKSGHNVKMSQLKVLREAFDAMDPHKTGFVSYEQLLLGEEGEEGGGAESAAEGLPPAWRPLRALLAKVLHEQRNSSVFLPAKQRGPMRDAAFRKRVSSRMVCFRDLLVATFPLIPHDELERLESTARWVAPQQTQAVKTGKDRAGTPREPKRLAVAIWALLDKRREGSITLDTLEAFLRGVLPFPAAVVRKTFFPDTFERILADDCIYKEDFVAWYLSLWRSCKRPACGNALDDFYRCDPVGKLNAYLEAERKRRREASGHSQSEETQWRVERQRLIHTSGRLISRTPTKRYAVHV